MERRIRCIFFVVGMITAFTLAGSGRVCAEFICNVKSIEGKQLVLENCQEKGLKRLKPGDKVGIIKKRKK